MDIQIRSGNQSARNQPVTNQATVRTPPPILDLFQDIVDEAKRRIHLYCPEWTDHNVSDPGVALIELFAWMTEMQLYRANQIPERMFEQFLKLLCMPPTPAVPAQADITFYVAGLPAADVMVPITEVATPRTETSEPVIFTTSRPLTIYKPQLVGLYSYNHSQRTDQQTAGWIAHPIRQNVSASGGLAENLLNPRMPISIFPGDPEPTDALYFAFAQNLSHHILALTVVVDEASGTGIGADPPIRWEIARTTGTQWTEIPAEDVYDETAGFNKYGENRSSGTIVLRLSRMDRCRLPDFPIDAYPDQSESFWLRCILTDRQSRINDRGEKEGYKASPRLSALQIQSLGATVSAYNAVTISNEVLGRSSGAAGQTFRLTHYPILSLEPETDYLEVELPDGTTQTWTEVPDFAASGRDSRHFQLEKRTGVITLGPTLLQPDGHVYNFGAVPPKDCLLRFSRYQYGGGVQGNVPTEAIRVCRSEIASVARVVNHKPARGGRNAESLEHAQIRIPQKLRARDRAVTADDFETLTLYGRVVGAARACCVSVPTDLNGSTRERTVRGQELPAPGHVHVHVLPECDLKTGRIPIDRISTPEVREQLLPAIERELRTKTVLGVSVSVREPYYIFVAVVATLQVRNASQPSLVAAIERRAEQRLYSYLNPYTGGPDGMGWPFGRHLYVRDIYSLLYAMEDVDAIVELNFLHTDPNNRDVSQTHVIVPPNGLICSDRHQITAVTGSR